MASQVESIKWVPGTNFIVDGFRFPSPRCTHYFLTHGHSDHTTGLSRSWDAGLIYCSPVTARLLRHDMGIRADCLRILEPGCTTTIAGVQVTPIPANHCPGAVMLLFRIPPASATAQPAMPPAAAGCAAAGAGPSQACSSTTGGTNGSTDGRSSSRVAKPTVILHTGDFRWHPSMAEHPALKDVEIDVLMLDTTYCKPKWTFPAQDQVVGQLAELMAAEARDNPRTLFVVSSYHIGKERAYLGAAARLGWRVFAPPAKRRVLALLDLPASWMALLTDRPEEARIHVAGMGEQMHPAALQERLSSQQSGSAAAMDAGAAAGPNVGSAAAAGPAAGPGKAFGAPADAGCAAGAGGSWGSSSGSSGPSAEETALGGGCWDRIVAVRATGWTFRKSGKLDVREEGRVKIYGVPYSEHSSYDELRDCVRTLRPRRLIPTVNASDPGASRAIVDRFAALMDLSKDRSRLDCYFLKDPTAAAAAAAGALGGASSSQPAHEASNSGTSEEAAAKRARLPGASMREGPSSNEASGRWLQAVVAPAAADVHTGQPAAAVSSQAAAQAAAGGSLPAMPMELDCAGLLLAAVKTEDSSMGAAPQPQQLAVREGPVVTTVVRAECSNACTPSQPQQPQQPQQHQMLAAQEGLQAAMSVKAEDCAASGPSQQEQHGLCAAWEGLQASEAVKAEDCRASHPSLQEEHGAPALLLDQQQMQSCLQQQPEQQQAKQRQAVQGAQTAQRQQQELETEDVILAAVDVAEQHRILEAIQLQQRQRKQTGKQRSPGSVSGGRQLRQGSLKAFFKPGGT